MALLITGSIDLDNGIELPKAYARIDTSLSLEGDALLTNPIFWADQQSFTDGLNSIRIFDGISFTYPYDRTAEGSDLLTVGSQNVAATLEALGYDVLIEEI